MRALIINQNPKHHAAFQRAVFRNGFKEVCSIFDSNSALIFLEPGEDGPHWDLVLLDHLPDGEDGFSVCRFLAALPVEKRPRLVAVTEGDGTARAKMLAILWEAWIKAVASPVTDLDQANLRLPWLPAMLKPAKEAPCLSG